MRTLFSNPALNLSLEGDTVDMLEASTVPSDEQIIALENISTEEAEVFVDQATTASVQADSLLSEAERILEVSDALEELSIIASTITKATPQEAALIETMGNMAVAGSDVDPVRIIPAMEAYIGGKISIESIRETARVIWENIQKFLKQVWDAIEGFYTNILSTLPRMRKALDELERRARAVHGTHPGKEKLKFSNGVGNFYVNGKPMTSEHDLLSGYNDLRIAAKWTYGTYMDSVSKRGHVIAAVIAKIDPANIEQTTDTLRFDLQQARSAPVPGGSGKDSTRFPGFTATAGTALPGNVSIVCKYYDDNKDTVTALGALDRFRNSRCELLPTTDSHVELVNLVEITPLTNSAMGTMINDMRELLDTLSSYKYGPKSKAIAASKKLIVDASAKAERAVGALDKNDEGYQATSINYRALLNFNAAYARWAQTPAMPMMRHAINVTKTMMIVIQKSLASYEHA